MSTAWWTLSWAFAMLVGSLFAGRVISVSALILFSYLAGPEPFAEFGFYFAGVSVLGIVACARYEQAIVFASDSTETRQLAWLAALIAAGASAAVLAILAVWPVEAAVAGRIGAFLTLAIPISLMARALNRIASNLATHARSYGTLSQANLAQAIVQACLQLGLLAGGMSPVNCLIIGDIGGVVAATGVLAATGWREGWSIGRFPKGETLLQAARTWRVMPTLDLPTSLVSVAALSLPALILPLAYSAALAGQLVLAMRLLDLPSSILASAATPFVQRELATAPEKAAFLRLAIRVLSILSTVLFAGIALAAVSVSGLFAGTRWETAIAAVPYLAVYFAGLTISGPLVAIVNGLKGERRAAAAHVAFLLLTFAVGGLMWAGAGWGAGLTALGLTAVVRAAHFGWLLVRIARDTAARQSAE